MWSRWGAGSSIVVPLLLLSSAHLVVVLVIVTSSSSWSLMPLAPAIHPTSSCSWWWLGVLWSCRRVLPSPSLLYPPPRCGPLPFVVVPSHCSSFPPREQLLTVAVGGAVGGLYTPPPQSERTPLGHLDSPRTLLGPFFGWRSC